jgi:hypothetical protein
MVMRMQHSWSQNHILPAIKFEEIIDIDMEEEEEEGEAARGTCHHLERNGAPNEAIRIFL